MPPRRPPPPRSRGWAARAPRERAEILRRSWELLTERADDLARLITLENGKVLAEAKGEITYAAEFFRWFSEEAVRLPGELTTAPGGANRILVLHQPVGVAYLVTPWNFPAAMATRKIAPALAAGCAVVLKPATLTPLTALAVADVLAEAGVPDGVVNVVPGRSASTITAAVLEHERVRKLSFTGQHRGRQAADRAGRRAGAQRVDGAGRQRPVHRARRRRPRRRHRGGDDRQDAPQRRDLHRRQPLLRRGAGRRGLRRQAGGRDGRAARRATASTTATASARSSTPTPATRWPSSWTAPSPPAPRRIVGGERPTGTGFYYPATVLTGVAADNPILEEEIFGPVAPIVSVADADEAVRLANGTTMGLVAYVYTGDLAKGLRVAEALESGMVGLNKGIVSDPAAPFGGVKESGIGREGGHEGMLDYTETKYIATDW